MRNYLKMDSDIFFIFTVIIAISIIIYAYLKKKIDISAVLASGIVGIVVLLTLGERWNLIYLVVGFFILGNLVTKYKYSVKKKRRVAEGVRTFRNVFGNGGAATIYSLLFFLTNSQALLSGILGAMATAAADTFATEIGQAHEKNPRLITNLKRVPVGKSGAVSVPGLIGSLLGSGAISIVPVILGSNFMIFFIGIISGFIGCIIDSIMGATFERKIIDKHMTNFVATMAGGLIAVILSSWFEIFI